MGKDSCFEANTLTIFSSFNGSVKGVEKRVMRGLDSISIR